MLRRLAALTLLVSLATPVWATSPVTNYTVKTHTDMWRADGSSSTRGSGSIAGWPTKTGGTASCSLSQVTSGPESFTPPGSVGLIKVDCTAGASPSVVGINMVAPSQSIANIGLFGFYVYDELADNSALSSVNILVATSGFTKYFRYSCATITVGTQRKPGWNFCQWTRGDENQTVGSMTYSDTVQAIGLQITPIANTSFTMYFSGFIRDYYARPQIIVVAADNGVGAYTNMYSYMNDSSRKIRGSYLPTTNYLANPGGGQITVAQLQEMQTGGWTMVPHQTDGTTFIGMTDAQLRYEIASIWAVHDLYGFRYRLMLQPPGGATNAFIRSVFSSLGILYTTNANAGNDQTGRALYGGLVGPMQTWSYAADGKTFAQVKTVIDWCVKYGAYTAILWHDGSGGDLTAMQQSMDYLTRLRDANILDVVSYEEFFKRFANARKVRY